VLCQSLLGNVPRKLPNWVKKTLNKGHFAVQGHSRSPILVDDFLLVINANLPPILHRFGVIAFKMSEIAIFRYPSCV